MFGNAIQEVVTFILGGIIYIFEKQSSMLDFLNKKLACRASQTLLLTGVF